MRAIDADILKAGFEEDGHLTPYIESMIDACPTVGEWISVKDRLPEIKCWVLAHCVCEEQFKFYDPLRIAKLLANGEWETDDSEYPFLFKEEKITHWMPLPEPPKEE